MASYRADVLATSAQIRAACARAARWIDEEFAGKTPVLIGVLRACVPYYGEVLNRVRTDCTTDFVRVVGRDGPKPSFAIAPHDRLDGRPAVVFLGMVRSGATAAFLRAQLSARGASQVRVVALVRLSDAPAGAVDFSLFEAPTPSVAGFGIGNDGLLRNLPRLVRLRG